MVQTRYLIILLSKHCLSHTVFIISAAEATVGCTSNTECSLKESCINRLCISPCNCGPNAECRVTNHYAICFCRPGYSGNPQIGCVKREYSSLLILFWVFISAFPIILIYLKLYFWIKSFKVLTKCANSYVRFTVFANNVE